MALYPYQQKGVAFLQAGARRYLGDEMGLGKTVQALVALRDARQALLVGPASVLPNWEEEAKEWAPGLHLVTVSYTKLARNPEPYLRDWEAVILDEAHYAKNQNAARTQAALDVARRGERAYLLSGTPLPNNDPGELWAPVKALWPEIPEALGLDTWFEWFSHFCYWRHTQYGPKAYGLKNVPEFREVLSRIMLRRKLASVALDLPPLRVTRSWLPEMPALKAELEELDLVSDDPENQPNAARVRRILGTHKVPVIANLVKEELADGQYKKIVVLAYHRDSLAHLRAILKPFGVVGFDGSTPGKERQKAIDAFTNGGARVFVAQQTSAGTGINLQVASEIILAEPSWTPAENIQAIKRIHRIGQNSPCRARLFAARGSLDEALMSAVAGKMRREEALGL